jgi:hypothetical protein
VPESCSVTASSASSGGTVVTISAPSQGTGTTYGAFVAFSCF